MLQGLAFDCTQLPVTSENDLVDFVAYCFDHLELKFTTIKLYLCGYMIKMVAPLSQSLHSALLGKKESRVCTVVLRCQLQLIYYLNYVNVWTVVVLTFLRQPHEHNWQDL